MRLRQGNPGRCAEIFLSSSSSFSLAACCCQAWVLTGVLSGMGIDGEFCQAWVLTGGLSYSCGGKHHAMRSWGRNLLSEHSGEGVSNLGMRVTGAVARIFGGLTCAAPGGLHLSFVSTDRAV